MSELMTQAAKKMRKLYYHRRNIGGPEADYEHDYFEDTLKIINADYVSRDTCKRLFKAEQAYSNISNWLARAVSESKLLTARDQDELDYFKNRVLESRSILELTEDWDDNGSAPFSEAHWRRATDFLCRIGDVLWDQQLVLIAPSINPVSGGSIDLHWKTENSELLINVPSPEDKRASFYGDSDGRLAVKGELDLTHEDWPLFIWLKLTR